MEKNKAIKRNTEVFIIILGCLLAIVFLSLYFFQFNGDLSSDQLIFGSFGDYVGGIVGTVFTAISIFFIYKTYRQQVLFSEEQQRLSTRQSFESSFFSLLNLQHEILLSLSKDGKTGYDYISLVAEQLKLRLSSREYDLESIAEDKINQELEIIDIEYNHVFSAYGSQLGHYFRNLYHILLYVKDSEIDDKSRYFKLIQAQLSNEELYLLFYNSISHFGKEKLYPIVCEYAIIENLIYPDFEYFQLHQHLFYPQIKFKY